MDLRTNPIHDVLAAIDHIAHELSIPLSDPGRADKVFAELKSRVTDAFANPIVLHGNRTQSMFAYVAASLGHCTAIKQEDCGELIAPQPISVPDYRLILTNGQEWFVEVKNCYALSFKQLRRVFKQTYIEALTSYSRLFKRPLKIAVYWLPFHKWTIVSADQLRPHHSKYVLTFEDAMKANEMADLGDMSIGAVPPLIFRVYADPAKPRSISPEGHAEFAIRRIALLSDGHVVDDKDEQALALHFMMYGKWSSSEWTANMVDGELESIELVVEPHERSPDGQPFEIIGDLSGMIARRYDELTAPDGTVERFSPRVAPDSLGVSVSDEYEGKALKLWRFRLKPQRVISA